MTAPAYDHRQTSWWLLAGLMIVTGAAVAVLAWLDGRTGRAARISLVSIAAIGLLVGWQFTTLRVEVNAERVRIAFGPGWIRRVLPVAQIVAAEAVRNRWWYGWGIRWTPTGWMWNVSGLDAVLVTLKGGRRFRIGTDEPARLVAALDAAVAPARAARTAGAS
jgi:hypothetical protein